MFNYPMNETIAQKLFVKLVLDYEFEDMVCCRVILDDTWLKGRLSAKNRDEAIAKFENHEWEDI